MLKFKVLPWPIALIKNLFKKKLPLGGGAYSRKGTYLRKYRTLFFDNMDVKI